MATRGTNLSERIQRIIGINDERVTPVLIFDTINDKQREIAERLLCIEASSTITTNSSGVASEPSGFFRLKRIVFPDNSEIFPQEIDVQQYDTLQHLLFTNVSETVQYYKRWNGSFTFFPNPGVQTWTIYFYAIPTTTASTSVAPEIPAYMDTALRYGTLSELFEYKNDKDSLEKAIYYKNLYEAEMNRLQTTWRRSKTVSNQIQYHDV